MNIQPIGVSRGYSKSQQTNKQLNEQRSTNPELMQPAFGMKKTKTMLTTLALFVATVFPGCTKYMEGLEKDQKNLINKLEIMNPKTSELYKSMIALTNKKGSEYLKKSLFNKDNLISEQNRYGANLVDSLIGGSRNATAATMENPTTNKRFSPTNKFLSNFADLLSE